MYHLLHVSCITTTEEDFHMEFVCCVQYNICMEFGTVEPKFVMFNSKITTNQLLIEFLVSSSLWSVVLGGNGCCTYLVSLPMKRTYCVAVKLCGKIKVLFSYCQSVNSCNKSHAFYNSMQPFTNIIRSFIYRQH